MLYILPAIDLSRSFQHQAKLFAETHGLDHTRITLEACREVIVSYICASVSSKLEWVDFERQRQNVEEYHQIVLAASNTALFATFAGIKDADQHDEHFRLTFAEMILNPEVEIARAMARLFDWYVQDDEARTQTYDEDPNVVLSDEFYCTIIDDVILAIEGLIGEIIPDQTWDVWTVKRLGRDLYLEQGDDYRIQDWLRRVKRGGLL